MKYSIIIILQLICLSSFSQIIKTYSGDLYSGKVTYSYYDDTLTNTEIRHGAYKFYEKESYQEQSYTKTVTGNYKHGYKNGTFTYCSALVDNPSGELYNTGTITVKMSYKDGIPDGEWSYKLQLKSREKKFTMNGWSWSPYEIQPSETIIVHFTNGVMTGKVYYNTNIDKIFGQLDQKGRWVGEWKINNSEMSLDSGFVIKYKKRNDFNSEITSQFSIDNISKEFIFALKQLPIEQIDSFCEQNNLNAGIQLGSNYFDIFESSFFNSYDLIESNIGIKPLNKEDRYANHKRNGYLIFISSK